MQTYTFQTNNPDVIEFIETLGRKRSVVLEAIFQDIIDEYDGYLPPHIIAETGFRYKKAMKPTKKKRKKVQKELPVKHKKEPVAVEPKEVEAFEEPVTIEEPEVVIKTQSPEPVVSEPVTSEITQQSKALAGRNVNAALVLGGISAFDF